MKKKTTYTRPRTSCMRIGAGLLLAGSDNNVTMSSGRTPQDDVSAAKRASIWED